MKKTERLKAKLQDQINNEDLFNAYITAHEILESSEELEVIYQLGITCTRIGKVKEAKSHLENYIKTGGDNPFAKLNLGHMLKAGGEIEAAARQYRNFIQENPKNCGHGYWHLSDLKDKQAKDGELAKMMSLLSSTDVNDTEKMLIQFAIGNYHDRENNSTDAFMAFKSANAYHAMKKPFNKTAYEKLIADLQVLKEVPKFNFDDIPYKPIFILGLPRSGSTLCEQILSSHSSVLATDELPFINAIGAGMESSGSYTKAIQELTNEKAQELRSGYIENCKNYIDTPCEYFIDKSPINSLHIGLIKTLFPEALIINSYRNSLDNALSMYRRYFFMGHEYAYSLDDIAMYMDGYIMLMQHWDSVFPEKVFHCRYETLVKAPNEYIKKMLTYCGLPFEDNCLTFYKNKRAVLTPSSDQVSKPIYSSSIGSWEKYVKQIAPQTINHLSYVNQRMITSFEKDAINSAELTWSDYWSKGYLSSFSEKNYDGILKDYWIDFSGMLASEDQVLDLCSGNGALLNIIYDALDGRTSTGLVGVDYANIQAFNKPYQLHGNVSIESLPYDALSYSFVISQFGIEYSNIEKSIQEVARILQADGQFRFICHAEGSVILKNNKKIYECSESLEKNAFGYFSEMLMGLDLIAQGDSTGEALAAAKRENFNAAIVEHHEKYGDTLFETGFPQAMKNILQQKKSGHCQNIFKDFVVSFNMAQKRIEQLFSAALDEQRKNSFLKLLSNNKLKAIECKKIEQEQVGIIGWSIEGVKIA